jgi:two-component system nitrate/nitrite sensor histidine kinase NarX
MLEAVVEMAGASAGVLRVVGLDGTLEPTLAVGLPGDLGRAGAGAIAFWCGRCEEARNPGSDCVRSGLCAAEDRFSLELTGRACRHVLAVPVRLHGRTIGTLGLHFDADAAFAPPMMPLLSASGALIGVALENARLAREELRASLVTERQAMSNEVHDSLAQGLTYMRMRMSLLREAVREGDDLRAFKYWGDVDASLTEAHRRLRELIRYFRSRMDPRGLAHALADVASSFEERTGIALEYGGVAGLALPVGRELEVFHVVQEALANVVRHANARHARLSVTRKDASWEIAVEDDGVGLPPEVASGDAADSGHFGIAIMRERARRLGGELRLESRPGGGTRVRLQFPLEAPGAPSRP